MNWTVSLACLLVASCASATVRVSGELCEVSVPANLGEHRATELARVADFLAPQVARCPFLPTATAIPIEVSPERYIDVGAVDGPGTYGAVWVGHRSRILLGSVSATDCLLFSPEEALDDLRQHRVDDERVVGGVRHDCELVCGPQ